MAKIKCPVCGQQVDETEKICPVCGVEIAGHVVRCHVCGEVYFNDEALCPNCHSSQFTILGQDETYSDDDEAQAADTEPVEDEEPVSAPATTPEEKPSAPAEEQAPVSHPVAAEEKEIVETLTEKEDKPTASVASPSGQPSDEVTHDDDDQDDEDVSEDDRQSKLKRNMISFVVSIAVTLLVAAISIYYYQETKMAKEYKEYERAISHNDTTLMKLFLRSFPDATKAHTDTIRYRINEIRSERKALADALQKRDKKTLMTFLSQHPYSKERQKILLIVDTLDWDSTLKVNNRQAYQDYLTAHAEGSFAEAAKEKLSDKDLETTQADRDKISNLFHDFFVSINTNDQDGLRRNLSDKIGNFMGTEGATPSQVVSWMERQHGEDVSKVIWRLNRDYKINKREVSGLVKYSVDFTAQRDITKKDGKTKVEHFKIVSEVNGNGKVTSMNMSTYTPKANPPTQTSSSTQASSKPSTSSAPAQKPASTSAKPTSTSAKPAEKPKSTGTASTGTAQKAKN